MDAENSRIEIRKLGNKSEAETCAGMMSSLEPWVTLKRDYETSLKIITDPSREVYLALVGEEIAGFTILVMQGALVGYIQSICVGHLTSKDLLVLQHLNHVHSLHGT